MLEMIEKGRVLTRNLSLKLCLITLNYWASID